MNKPDLKSVLVRALRNAARGATWTDDGTSLDSHELEAARGAAVSKQPVTRAARARPAVVFPGFPPFTPLPPNPNDPPVYHEVEPPPPDYTEAVPPYQEANPSPLPPFEEHGHPPVNPFPPDPEPSFPINFPINISIGGGLPLGRR